jgi:hypothetical protein
MGKRARVQTWNREQMADMLSSDDDDDDDDDEYTPMTPSLQIFTLANQLILCDHQCVHACEFFALSL